MPSTRLAQKALVLDGRRPLCCRVTDFWSSSHTRTTTWELRLRGDALLPGQLIPMPLYRQCCHPFAARLTLAMLHAPTFKDFVRHEQWPRSARGRGADHNTKSSLSRALLCCCALASRPCAAALRAFISICSSDQQARFRVTCATLPLVCSTTSCASWNITANVEKSHVIDICRASAVLIAQHQLLSMHVCRVCILAQLTCVGRFSHLPCRSVRQMFSMLALADMMQESEPALDASHLWCGHVIIG